MVLTAQHDREVRIAAPVDFVWNEVSNLNHLLPYFHEVRSHDVDPGGRSAKLLIASQRVDRASEEARAAQRDAHCRYTSQGAGPSGVKR